MPLAAKLLGTDPQTLTGTVTVSAAGTNVTGSSTLFTSELTEGDALVIAGEIVFVDTITNNTALVLTYGHTNGATDVTYETIERGLFVSANGAMYCIGNVVDNNPASFGGTVNVDALQVSSSATIPALTVASSIDGVGFEAGVSTILAAPPAIGAGTPAAGTFTALTAEDITVSTGNVSLTAGHVDVVAGEIRSAGDRVGYNIVAQGAGTAYSLTNTASKVDFGTTDPIIILNKAGTYLILATIQLTYTGATVATETATIKVRRTNNTAADLSSVVVLDLPVSTTLTHTYGIFAIPPFVYTTAAVDDSIEIYANVSAALSAGTIDATAVGTKIVAIRLY